MATADERDTATHASPPEPDASSAEREIIIITGMSGAGRSEAMHTFEDLGYFCIDNLPPAFIGQLVALTALPGSRVHRVAVVCDVRGGSFFSELSQALDALSEEGHPYQLVFLTADDRTLVQRFKETRRRHPLADERSLVQGIRTERELLRPFEDRADVTIDTSNLRPAELRAVIRERFSVSAPERTLTVTVSSFGFKYGLPVDADIVMDVRFLPNPYYVPRLRARSGLERPVRTFVLEQVQTEEFLTRWFDLLDLLLPEYLTEGKTHLHIAMGCTGGMHRSVVLAEQTAEHLRRHDYAVNVTHRDIGKDKGRE
ncbi:MAG: RNase adapter RapZ [Coriobacteriales bacterium]|nr:RNase adapter RapZ [Actinomycetes bacterium]